MCLYVVLYETCARVKYYRLNGLKPLKNGLAYLMQMTLEKELNPIESDDLNDVFAVTDVDLFARVEQGEEKFEASITEQHPFHHFVLGLV